MGSRDTLFVLSGHRSVEGVSAQEKHARAPGPWPSPSFASDSWGKHPSLPKTDEDEQEKCV